MKKPVPKHWPFLQKASRHWQYFRPRNRKTNGVRVYSNLSNRDVRSRRKAEYLASLPKNPVMRFIYRLHPKRLYHYWFSRQGAIMFLKLCGIGFILLTVLIISLFAVYRKDLDQLNPNDLSNLVNNSATTYWDRSGKVLLYSDNASVDKTIVASNQITPYMKEATVSIEDKNFYKEGAISIPGLIRAVLAHLVGGSGGGSTITEQLVKNVFLTDNATITYKIKEIILAEEASRLYSKDQILTMYLNEAPYGGDRVGVQAAAQAYFGTTADHLSLAQAAMLASIPQLPTAFDPQSQYFDKEGLVSREQTTLQKMAQQGYITWAQEKAAAQVNVVAEVLPPTTNTQNIIAPAFVFNVQHQLEQQYGTKLVTQGGLKVITTLDVSMQNLADKLMAQDIHYDEAQGGNNMAMVAEDNQTGQVLAYEGSRDYNYPGYGAFDAATAMLEPGSSVKIFDYGQLFKQRPGTNYAPGSVLSDEPINIAGYSPKDFDDRYRGNIDIRSALDESRNIPAVKAAYISGMSNVATLAHQMGDLAFCDSYCGLSAAIGGYPLELVQHTNAYATLARQGLYIPQDYLIEIKGSNGDPIYQWKQPTGTQVISNQIEYELTNILNDAKAREPTFGSPIPNRSLTDGQVGFNPPGIKIAVKTGTTDDDKDGWMMGYSTVMTLGVWVGNANGTPMVDPYTGQGAVTHLQTGPFFGDFFQQSEPFMYGYGWKGANDWFTAPSGIHSTTVDGNYDLVPSWWGQIQSATNGSPTTITMDEVSKRKATSCTPPLAQQQITVYEVTDPITHQTVYNGVPAGYDINDSDNVHNCSDTLPQVSTPTADTSAGTISFVITQGTFPLQSFQVQVNGQTVATQNISSGGQETISYAFTNPGSTATISVSVTDTGLYQATSQQTVNVINGQGGGGGQGGGHGH
ncbi:MAG TPA: transglycosylase domain-containing protein [Candidatus Saccharimonadales bacterium]|nr:transglycosylase domain-containing protein [Candidatus Saccharimonadales bacterium]